MNKKTIIYTCSIIILILANAQTFSCFKQEFKNEKKKNAVKKHLTNYFLQQFKKLEMKENCKIRTFIKEKWKQANKLRNSEKKSDIKKMAEILENDCIAYQMIIPKIRYIACLALARHYAVEQNYKKATLMIYTILEVADKEDVEDIVRAQALMLKASMCYERAEEITDKKIQKKLKRESAIANNKARNLFNQYLKDEAGNFANQTDEIYIKEKAVTCTIEVADYLLEYTYSHNKTGNNTQKNNKIKRYLRRAENCYEQVIQDVKKTSKYFSPDLAHAKAVALIHLPNTYRHPQYRPDKPIDKLKILKSYKKAMEFILANQKIIKKEYSVNSLIHLANVAKSNAEKVFKNKQ